jgi:2-polyprenyl-6-methoxyphenol hydroxylase-like FAD-dependent oxidoreductase
MNDGILNANGKAHTNGTSHTNGVSHTNGNTDAPLPIVIAGGGCVGMFLAVLLAQSHIPNRVIVVEPQQPDPTATRAMAHQPITYPIFSKVDGLLPELVKTGTLSSGLCFRTSVANGSRVIAGKKFDNSGEGMKGKGQLLLPQGKFQAILLARLDRMKEKAEVKIGYSVSSVQATGEKSRVNVKITPTSSEAGEEETLKAAYLIDASGGHSPIRKHLNIPLEGETLDAQLVATDLYFDFHAHAFYDANFIIDPLNYGLIGLINPATENTPALWRVSYGVPLSPPEAEVKATLDAKLQCMLPNGGRDTHGNVAYKVVRDAPYSAQQRLASTLYHTQSRTCLVGDAAHLTNPYGGVGLASGMADASSLAEVLIHILTSRAADAETLLTSWSEARRQNFRDVVDKPSRMAYKRVRSDVATEEKVRELMARDPMVNALKKGMPVQPPSLETRGEGLEGW